MQCSTEGEVIWKKQNNLLENGNDDEDIWDDALLIKAYDKAIASLKNENQEEPQSVASSDSVTKKSNKNRKKKKKKKKQKPNEKSLNEIKHTNDVKWKMGDKCLALYEEDQLYYEGTILDIDRKNCKASIRFDYYENEEEINLSDLLSVENINDMDTHGNSSEDEQSTVFKKPEEPQNIRFSGGWRISDLCYIQDDHGIYHQAVINSFITSTRCMVTYIKSGKRKEVKVNQLKRSTKGSRPSHPTFQRPHTSNPWFPNFEKMMQPPYPPPPPPSMFGFNDWNFFDSFSRMPAPFPPFPPPPPPPHLNNLPDDLDNPDEEALANMLMSSYMNGYHTGYYQGLIQGKKVGGKSQDSSYNSSV